MNSLELKVPPVALLLFAAAGMWLVARILPAAHFSVHGSTLLAIATASAGVLLALHGVFLFRGVGTTVDPRAPERSAKLVTCGAFRYSRNPMYLGFLLVLIGWGVFLGSVLSLLFIPAFAVYLDRFQVVPEERLMQAKFGERYTEYAARVRRWI